MASLKLDPASLDISGIRAGDKNLIEMTLTQNGEPLDLTGMTIEAQARRMANDPDALTAVIEVLDAAAGKLSMRWPGEDVRTMIGEDVSWSGFWDLQTSTDGNDPVTIVAGKFSATMDITRQDAP